MFNFVDTATQIYFIGSMIPSVRNMLELIIPPQTGWVVQWYNNRLNPAIEGLLSAGHSVSQLIFIL